MKRATRITVISLLLVVPNFSAAPQFPGARVPLLAHAEAAQADESWKQEFEDVCGKTDDSMSLSKDELKSLMARCDKLKPVIEAQEETTRKVYLKRLQMCRDLLAYVYEVKSKN